MSDKNQMLPLLESQWSSVGVTQEGASLMTPLALIEGEILNLVEIQGAITLKDVIKQAVWPEPLIFMGVGALIRQGLLQSRRAGFSIVLEKGLTDVD